MNNIGKLQQIFKNKEFLRLALTHKSWVNEHPGERQSNERLEFLGDAILEFIISSELFRQFPKKEEGYLTALRANLVNTVNLAEVAKKMDVGASLYLSKGEEEGGGRQNQSLLADTVEAIIGALYLDGGIETAEHFIKENLIIEIPKKITKPLKDAKSRLQEYVQSQGFMAPKYAIIEQSGPDHNKNFVVEVFVNGESWGKGVGKSKSLAEQEAAKAGLEKTL